jgi:hypothetical protein
MQHVVSVFEAEPEVGKKEATNFCVFVITLQYLHLVFKEILHVLVVCVGITEAKRAQTFFSKAKAEDGV